MQLFASLPERGNENIKYSIFLSGNRTHILSRLQSHLYPRATTGPYSYNLVILLRYLTLIG